MTLHRAALAALSFAGAALVLLGGCSRKRPLQPFAQPDGYLWTVDPRAAPPIASGRFSLDSLSTGNDGHFGFPIVRLRYASPRSRLHPDLLPLLRASPKDTSGVALIVGLHDRTVMIRLPIERLAAEGDSAKLAGGRATVDSLRARVRADRALWYPHQEDELRARFGAVIGPRFELTQAVVARVPRNRVRALAQWNEVTSIRPLQIQATPPQGGGTTASPTSVLGAATRMGLTGYRTAGLTTGRIRLLDTGVDATHPWLATLPGTDMPGVGVGPALVPHDCIGPTPCAGNAPGDCISPGHGTPSAAILVARGNAPVDSRGITDARLHTCRVWWRDATAYMWQDASAIESALAGTYSSPASVAVVEVVDAEGPDGVIAGSANGAFGDGVVVVAPIGNSGPPVAGNPYTGAQSPGNARGVLGIGARESSNPAQDYVGQSHGGVKNRGKPDVQALTGTVSAKVIAGLAPGSIGAGTMTLGETSGAAPYAGAAALAVRALLTVAAGQVDPGQVYAALVACGDELRTATGAFPSVRGAGLVTLPVVGRCWLGSRRMRNGAHRNFHVHVTDPKARELRVGLWWKDPEPVTLPFGLVLEAHYDFDLELVSPQENTVATSSGVSGVFERVAFPPAGQSPSTPNDLLGIWRVRVRARNVATSGSRVYWTAFTAP